MAIKKSGFGINSYDLKRDSLALEIRPNYEIRFNVLHKWIEKYSKRTLADQRDDHSVGFSGHMIGATDEFYFLENRKNYRSGDGSLICLGKKHTKKEITEKRDELEKKYFGNKGDNPNN